MTTIAKFTREQIFEFLQRSINNTLIASGKAPVDLNWDMKPLLAITDLDSQMGVEVTLDIELQLGVDVDLGINVLIDSEGARPKARTVRETVAYIRRILAKSS